MNKNLWFDMDGTFVDFYGVENWLEYLIKEDTTPYRIAKPLINMRSFARVLNGLCKKGFTVNIVSWTSKNGSPEYNEKVKQVKIKWIEKHLKSVKFNHIDIIEYGNRKGHGRFGILFDDEERNRQEWNGTAYDVNDIIKTLQKLGA